MITTAYLVPGPNADKRFVQLAGEACYRSLIAAGMEVWCHQPSMLHAKVTTVDGAVAVIGSANLDQWSTSLDDEVVLVAFDDRVAGASERRFEHDLELADPIDLQRWRRRVPLQRVLERASSLARPWM